MRASSDPVSGTPKPEMPVRAASDNGGGRPRLVDGVLALALTLAVALVIAANFEGAGRDDPGAYLFAIGFGALVAIRRAAPRVMIVLTVIGVFAYYTLGYPVIGIALPAIAALYSSAELRRVWWATVSALVLVGVAAYFRVIEGEPLSYLYGYELVTNVALAAAAIVLGVAVRLGREARFASARIRAFAESEERHLARERMRGERMGIARDLHDTIGHQLAVASLHTGVAAEAIGRNEADAREALMRVRDATTGALQELRRTVKLLRSDAAEYDGQRAAVAKAVASASPEAAPGLAALDQVLESARSAGLQARLTGVPAGDRASAAQEAAVFRIVQEAITNVIRHADASRVAVGVTEEDGKLVVRIADDGTGASQVSEGAGIRGMRERVELLGGCFTAGSDSGEGRTAWESETTENRAPGAAAQAGTSGESTAGFAVEARLPLEGAETP